MRRVRILTAVDQILFSVNTIGQLALVAHIVGPTGLGQFAVVSGLVGVAAATVRASTGEVFLHLAARDSREIALFPVGASALIGMGLMPLVLAIAALPNVSILLASTAAVLLPSLSFRDNLRFLHYAEKQQGRAACWSLISAISDLSILGLSLILSRDVAIGIVALILSVAATSFLQLWTIDPVAKFKGSVAWVRDHGTDSRFFGMEALVGGASAYISVPATAGTLNIAASGALRVGQSLLGPVGVLLNSIRYSDVHLIAEWVQNPRSERTLWSYLTRVSGLLLVASTLIGVLLALLPISILQIVAGESASMLHDIILLLSLQKGLSAAAIPLSVALKAMGRGRVTVLLRIFTIGALLAGTVGGAIDAGLTGATVGMVVSTGLVLLAHLEAVRQCAQRHCARYRSSGDDERP